MTILSFFKSALGESSDGDSASDLSKEDLFELKKARSLLENPGIAPRLAKVLGNPIEKSLNYLPEKWSAPVKDAAQKAIEKGLDVAIHTLDGKPPNTKSSKRNHKLAAALTGATGGFFGFSALAVELPLTTAVMLRSIADIARSEGEDISSIESKMACLEVFALGGKPEQGDATETGYYAVRGALATTVSDASKFIAEKGLTKKGAPALVRLIEKISSRFSTAVAEKIAAQAVPLIGAIGGASVNLIFTKHFQDMARGHFTVRRLERKYGEEAVRKVYEHLD